MAGRVAYVLGCSENPDVEPIKGSRAFYPAAHPAWADFRRFTEKCALRELLPGAHRSGRHHGRCQSPRSSGMRRDPTGRTSIPCQGRQGDHKPRQPADVQRCLRLGPFRGTALRPPAVRRIGVHSHDHLAPDRIVTRAAPARAQSNTDTDKQPKCFSPRVLHEIVNLMGNQLRLM